MDENQAEVVRKILKEMIRNPPEPKKPRVEVKRDPDDSTGFIITRKDLHQWILGKTIINDGEVVKEAKIEATDLIPSPESGDMAEQRVVPFQNNNVSQFLKSLEEFEAQSHKTSIRIK